MITAVLGAQYGCSALRSNQRPLAIVGMGCRLPGAGDLREYWDLIASGRSAIQELPKERLDQSIYYSPVPCDRPRTLTRLGGIVSPYRGIRNLHQLTSSEVRQSDPAHLELFGVMEDAIESAHWDIDRFRGKKTGVYVGHTRGTGRCGEIVYRSLVSGTASWLRELEQISTLEPIQQDRIVASIVQDVQNRYIGPDLNRAERLAAFHAVSLISKGFGLEGPSVALNSACASSLVALSYAGEALSLNEIDVAVVGSGSFVEFDSLVLFSRAGSVSRTGSRPFDAGADGLIPAEGYVIFLVKTLERALEDGDAIMAVIRGFGYSSDGKGKSLWAPREEGQVLAIHRAYGQSLSPTRLGYLEAHATSTTVGDATEMKALGQALTTPLSGYPKVPVGSVKANIGHTLETAGLAALAKTVLAIQHGQIPPVANVTKPNPNIDWENSPLYLPRELCEWKRSDSAPRRAGVNAFGIGGLNAHVIVEEFLSDYAKGYFAPDPECQRSGRSTGFDPVTDSKALGKSAIQTATVGPESTRDLSQLVAIVGLGAIAPGGNIAQDFWDATKDGNVHLGEPEPNRLDARGFEPGKKRPDKLIGGFLRDYQYDWRKHKVAPKQVANADPLQFMLLDAVDQAISDSGIELDQELRLRTGVVVGSVFGGEFGNALQMGLRLPEFSRLMEKHLLEVGIERETIETLIDDYQSLLLSRLPALNDETGSFTSSTLSSRITKTFDVMGGGSAIDGGGASGLYAIQIASNSLRSRSVDLMICACGQRSMGPFNYETLCHAGVLSSSGKVLVGSPKSDGMVPGEGAGVVVLKRLDEAIRDGNRIYAVVRGIEEAQGKNVEEAFRGLDHALMRMIDPAELAYVEVDANGQEDANDEFSSIQSQLTYQNRFRVPVAALKEQIGDTFGASSMLSVIRACKALASGTVPAAAWADEKRLPRHTVSLSSAEKRWDPSSDMPASVIVHASCDGTAAGVVLSNVASVSRSRSPSASNVNERLVAYPAWQEHHIRVSEPADHFKVVRFGADSVSELLHEMAQIAKAPTLAARENKSRNGSSLEERLSNLSTPPIYRLNIVAGNIKSLRQKISLAENALSNGKNIGALQNQGIFFGELGQSIGAKTAFLFAGQGSQYPKMLSSFLSNQALDRSILATIDDAVQRWSGQSFKALLEDERKRLGIDLLSTQLGILGCEVLLSQVLKDKGLVPDFLLGHSFGEYAAIYAAGCLELPQILEVANYRAQAVNQSSAIEGQLLCLFCDEETAERLITQSGIEAYIANCNSPQQTVIGAPKAKIHEVRQVFESCRIRTLLLPVPFAFHTPLMADATATMKALISEYPIRDSKCALLSAVSESFETSGEHVKNNLCDQFIKPVRWTRLVSRLRNQGATFFVEVGPGQVLTGLTRSIFRGDEEVVCVASDDSRTSAEEQLLFVEAAHEIHRHRTQSLEIPAVPSILSKASKTESTRLGFSMQAMGKNDPEAAFSLRRSNAEIALERIAALAVHRGDPWLGFEVEPDSYSISEKWHERVEKAACLLRTSNRAIINLNRFLEVESFKAGSQFITNDHAHVVETVFHENIAATFDDFLWRPEVSANGIRFVTLASIGQLGGFLGMNETGLTVSCMRPGEGPVHRDTQMTPPIFASSLVVECLGSCRTLDEAVSFIDDDPIAINWTWMLTHSSGESRFGSPLNGTLSFASIGKRSSENEQQIARDTLSRGICMLRVTMDSRAMTLSRRFQPSSRLTVPSQTIPFHAMFGEDRGTGSTKPNQPVKDPRPGASQENQEASTGGSFTINKDRTAIISVAELEAAGNSRNSLPPLGDQERICTRIVPKLVAAHGKLAIDWQKKFHAATVLILGSLPTLKGQLENWGARVGMVEGWLSSDSLLQRVSECRETLGSIEHVVVAPSFANRSPANSTWCDNSLIDFEFDRDVLSIYRIAQEWFSGFDNKLSPVERSWIVVTQMGGDIGLTGQSHRHTEGSLTGLAKAMFLERAVMVGSDLRTHAIDFELGASEPEVVEGLLREWAQEIREAEVGYRDGIRYVLRSIQQVLPRPAAHDVWNNQCGCWIITGGARGVTAEIAKAIALRCKGTVHLIGSSPVPTIPEEWLTYDETQLRELRTEIARKAAAEKRPAAEEWNAIEKAIEIKRNFHAMQKASINFFYHVCDVSSLSSVQALVDRIRSNGEPIVGVVHGAGFEKASRFASKKLPLVQRTFESKAIGALNLMVATAGDPIQSFIAFASISGRYGAIGQTDYGAANEWLTKIVARYATLNPNCHAVAIDWHSWGEVGMAARPETKHSPMLKTMRFMPVSEGVDHFLAELSLGIPSPRNRAERPMAAHPSEVVITDWNYHKLYFPDPVVPPTAYEPSYEFDGSKVLERTEETQSIIYEYDEWFHAPFEVPEWGVLDGLTFVIGSNATANAVVEQLQASGCRTIATPSPSTQADEEWIADVLSCLPVKTLIWLCPLDHGGYLGAGWKKDRTRLDRFASFPQRLVSKWLENPSSQGTRLIVSGNAKAIAESDRFCGQAFTPETSWLSSLISNHPERFQGVEVCKTLWLSNHDTPLTQSRSILQEILIVDHQTQIHRSSTDRWVAKRQPLPETSPTADLCSLPKGTWVVMGRSKDSWISPVAKILGPFANAIEWVDLNPWQASQKEIHHHLDFNDQRRFEDAQFVSILNSLQAIREKCGDTIVGIILWDPLDSCESGDVDVDCSKLISQAIYCAQPDNLQVVLVLSSSNDQMHITEQWLRWHSTKRGIRSTILNGVTPERENIAQLLSRAYPLAPGVQSVRRTVRPVVPSVPITSADESRTLALSPQIQDGATDRSVVCEVVVDPIRDPFLAEHRFRGRPLMPLVAIAEVITQVGIQVGILNSRLGVTLEDLLIVNGLKFFDDRQKSLFVRLEAFGERTKATVYYSFANSQGRVIDSERIVATGWMREIATLPSPQRIPFIPLAPWHPVDYPGEESVIYHGSPFRCIKKTQFFENGIIASFATQGTEALGGKRPGKWMTPMGVIDSALFACGVLAWTRDPSLVSIPAGVESISIFGQAEPGCAYQGIFSLDKMTANDAYFSGTILRDSGEVLLQIKGYRASLIKTSTH